MAKNAYAPYERPYIFEGFLIIEGLTLENVANMTILNLLNDFMYTLVL